MDQLSEQFQRDTLTFVEWFTATPATRLNPKLDLADLRDSGTGRGVVAKADIAEDEELFAIPRSLILDTTNSELQTQIDSPLSQFGSWSSLVLVIIYEYLRKDASPWYPYFKVLPKTFNTLMFWNPAELAELQGSAVLEKIGRVEAEEGWKTSITPFMKARPALFPAAKAGAEVNFVELAHMAGSLIMAYAFDLGRGDDTEEDADEDGFVEDDEEDPEKGMVPFADMLNADADRNNVRETDDLEGARINITKARLFHEETFLIMKATRAIVAGDEIFNDYGPLPRSDLLRMYGYVTDNYARYDVVELSSQIVYDAAQEIRKQNKRPEATVPRLEDLSDIEKGYAISRPSTAMDLDDAIPGDLRLLLSALAVDSESAVSASNVFGSGKRSFSSASAVLLASTIRKRLTDYKTAVVEDDDILECLRNAPSAQGASGMKSGRYRMAVQVRKGEKEILQHILELAQQLSMSKANGKRKRDTEDPGPNIANRAKATG